uniref:ATP-dependent DNA ligase n=1 Tax=Cupriavidus necator TaxID=106590 RepID=UPI003F4905F5
MAAVPPTPTLAELRPMLLCERKTIPRGPGWLFEIKYDGYRLLATTGSAPRLKSKNGADATTWFPELTDALAQLPAGYILDGEVCVLDDIGRSDFERLHARARRKGWCRGVDPVAFCVFDLLAGKGKDLRAQPIERRKAALKLLLAEPPPGLLYVDSVEDGAWLYRHALTLTLGLGLEGVIRKRAGSLYQSGERSRDWVKIKRLGAVLPQRFTR